MPRVLPLDAVLPSGLAWLMSRQNLGSARYITCAFFHLLFLAASVVTCVLANVRACLCVRVGACGWVCVGLVLLLSHAMTQTSHVNSLPHKLVQRM